MMDDKEQQSEVWSRAAATYSRVGPAFFQHFGSRLVELADIQPGERVLDVASGRGAQLFSAAKKAGPTGEVMGVDYAAGMVQETSAEIAARGINNISILQMDAEHLTFDNASFDRVLCGFAIFFFPQPRQALAEFYRVLKPDGTLAVSTWGPGDDRWAWLDQLTRAGQEESSQDDQDKIHYEKPEAMRNLLSQAGFTEAQVTEEKQEFYFTDPEEWWNTQWSHGARLALEKVPPEQIARLQPAIYGKLAEMACPQGIPLLQRVLFTVAKKPAK